MASKAKLLIGRRWCLWWRIFHSFSLALGLWTDWYGILRFYRFFSKGKEKSVLYIHMYMKTYD